HRGVATEFLLGDRGADPHPTPRTHDDHDHEGFFHRSVPVDGDVYGTMSAVCRFHGFSGLEPNTVMIDWHDHARHPDGFASFLSTVRELDLNLLALAFDADRGFGDNEQIDLWFSYETGFLPLHLALIRFVSSSDEWRRAKLRFLAIHDEPGVSDALHRTTTQALVDSRIEAQVKVIDNSVQRRPHAEYVVEYSDKADLTVIGLADLEITPDRVDELETMVRQIGVALFVRGSTGFTVAGTTHRPHHRSPTPVPGPNRLPSLVLPSIPALAQPAARFSVAHQQIVQRFVDMALRPIFESQMSLLDDVRHAIADLYQELSDEAKDDEIAAGVFEDAPCRLYADLAHQLDAYVTTELPKQQASLERSIELFVEGIGPLRRSVPRRIVARRPLSDFGPHEADPAPTRRYKARQRFWAMILQRRGIPTRLATRRLLRFHIDHGTRQWLDHAMRDAASRSLQFSTELGQLFNTLRDSLASLTGAALDRSLTPETVQIETDRLVRHLENFAQANQLATDRLAQRWLEDARAIQQTLASDLDTIHFRRHLRLQRRPPRGEPLEFDGFDELPSVWIQHQRLTLMRARLVPVVAEVQTRVLASVRRTRYAVRDAIDEGAFSRSQSLVDLLESMKDDPSPSEASLAEADFPEVVAFEPRTLDGLREELEAASASVPPEMDVITDDALSALQSDPFSEIEVVEIGLRRRFQFLVDGELVAPLRELLADVPREMSRATTNAQDVVRLVRFTLTEEASSDEGLEPVLKASVERLKADMSRLRQFDRAMGDQVEEHLEQVLDLTNGFALLGTVEALAQGPRRGSALGRMGAWPRQLAGWVREALVSLAYRRSATLLLARRVQNRTDPKPSAGVLALAEAFSPDPAVIQALPSFYTQLFSTQSTLHSAFWVDREHEIDRLEQAIVRYGRGFHGAIVITGDPGAGKTALCEVAIDRLLTGRRIVRVNPPAGGSRDPAVFRRALQLELSRRGRIEDLIGGLEPGSVVVMVDAQLWWERSESGTDVLDRVSDLVERFGDQVLFIIEMASPTLRFVQQYSPFGVGALDTIECGPVDARTLKEVVLSRHNSTGLRYSLDGRRDEELSDLTVAQLFTRHFDHTDGNIGAALQSWLAHIESVDAE
ncbi:MAG: ATP-binding protein, partial [Myxococcota bacterium]